MTDSTHHASLLAAQQHDGVPTSTHPTPIPADDGLTHRQKSSGQTREAVKDVVFGSTAGMVGKLIEYPFDTVKVRLQSSSRYAGPLDCLAQSFRAEGAAGLYRGISAPLFGAAVETSSLFFSYRLAQDAFRRTVYRDQAPDTSLSLPTLLACGAASGAFTSLLLTPIELVKCQLQVPLDAHGAGLDAGAGKATGQRNPFTVIAAVYRHGGVRGFWHGQLGTLIRETGGSAAWFGSYEGASAFFRSYWNGDVNDRSSSSSNSTQPPLAIWQQMVAGACAGVSYNFIFYPADTIKSRMQTAEVGGGGRSAGGARPTFWATGRLLWRQHGVRGMYRGCGITVARAAPSSAFIFTVNETLRGWFAEV